MSRRLILDPGSCHHGDLDVALELIRSASTIPLATAIKFQLFPNRPPFAPPNHHIPEEWIPSLLGAGRDNAIEVFFSVFGTDEEVEETMEHLFYLAVAKIKFAYSMRDRMRSILRALDTFEEVFVTTDVMDRPYLPLYHERLTVLHTETEPHGNGRQTKYPVTHKVDFGFLDLRSPDGFHLFHGFSDHTLGVKQTKAAFRAGAEVVEKHFKLRDTSLSCPDSRFSVSAIELKGLK